VRASFAATCCLQQVVYILSRPFDQPKSLFVLYFSCLLLDKYKLGLSYREKGFDIIDELGDIFDQLFEFRPMIKRAACSLQDTVILLSPDH
jgi:hypothetical protein